MIRKLRCFKVPMRDYVKIGRNQSCPCGSGNKYKKCCEPKGIIFKLKPQSNEV